MRAGENSPRKTRTKMLLAVAALAAAGFILLMALLNNVRTSLNSGEIDSASYTDELAKALAGADAEIGEKLIAETDCATCHLTGGRPHGAII